MLRCPTFCNTSTWLMYKWIMAARPKYYGAGEWWWSRTGLPGWEKTLFQYHRYHITLDFKMLPARACRAWLGLQRYDKRFASWTAGNCSLTTALKYDKLSTSVKEENGAGPAQHTNFFNIGLVFRGFFVVGSADGPLEGYIVRRSQTRRVQWH